MNHSLLLTVAISLFLVTPSLAEPGRSYPLERVRVVDGDTLEADIVVGFDVTLRRQKIRLPGYDAPETFQPKTPAERTLGMAAADALRTLLTQPEARVEAYQHQAEIKSDKYGRWLLGITVTNKAAQPVDVEAFMIERGYAKDRLKAWRERGNARNRVNVPDPGTSASRAGRVRHGSPGNRDRRHGRAYGHPSRQRNQRPHVRISIHP